MAWYSSLKNLTTKLNQTLKSNLFKSYYRIKKQIVESPFWSWLESIYSQVGFAWRFIFRVPAIYNYEQHYRSNEENYRKWEVANNVLYSSFISNVLYASPMIIYFGLFKPFLKNYVWEENSYNQYSVDALAYLYFSRQAIRMAIANTFLNPSIAKVTATACPEEPINNNGEDFRELVIGNVAMMMYATTNGLQVLLNSFGIKIFSFFAPEAAKLFSAVNTYGLTALSYGEAIISYPVSGRRLQERLATILGNKTFCWLLGLGLISATEAINYAASFVGVNNYFLADAVFYFLFQHCITLALTNKEPFPNIRPGWDIFYINRKISDLAIGYTVTSLAPKLLNENLRNRAADFVKEKINSPYTQVATHFLGIHTTEAWAKLPGIGIFFALNSVGINTIILFLTRAVEIANQIESYKNPVPALLKPLANNLINVSFALAIAIATRMGPAKILAYLKMYDKEVEEIKKHFPEIYCFLNDKNFENLLEHTKNLINAVEKYSQKNVMLYTSNDIVADENHFKKSLEEKYSNIFHGLPDSVDNMTQVQSDNKTTPDIKMPSAPPKIVIQEDSEEWEAITSPDKTGLSKWNFNLFKNKPKIDPVVVEQVSPKVFKNE